MGGRRGRRRLVEEVPRVLPELARAPNGEETTESPDLADVHDKRLGRVRGWRREEELGKTMREKLGEMGAWKVVEMGLEVEARWCSAGWRVWTELAAVSGLDERWSGIGTGESSSGWGTFLGCGMFF